MKHVVPIRLYSKYNIKDLTWPTEAWGRFAEGLLRPLCDDGVATYVGNIEAEQYVLKVGAKVLPLTVVNGAYENAYIASPYTHYVQFTAEELRLVTSRFIGQLLDLTAKLLKHPCRACEMNRIVLVNGWPLTTTFYPELTGAEVGAIRDFLVRRFPDHAIAFRSVDSLSGDGFEELFRQQGFRLIYYRPIYSLDPTAENFRPRAALRRDLNLLKKTDYEILSTEQLEERDIERISELYHKLYIQKYSACNPQYTTGFFLLLWRKKLMELTALKRDGRVDGFIASYGDDRQITDPFLGYDTDLPKSLGIYRMLAALVYLKAKERGVLLNYSAGVGDFKKRRGCRKSVEYLAVDDSHLSARRRLPWALLNATNDFAVSLMQRVDF
jgi:hypothetical protein